MKKEPDIDKTAVIMRGAIIAGDVTIGKESSVWFNTCVRGDNNSIYIGNYTCIEENCVLHCPPEVPMKIGNGVTVGHAGAAAYQSKRLVPGHLQALHEAQRHKVADVQGVRGRVEADVESGLAVVDHFPDLVLVCDLRDEAARLQFFINSHIDDLLYFSGEFHLKSPLLV